MQEYRPIDVTVLRVDFIKSGITNHHHHTITYILKPVVVEGNAIGLIGLEFDSQPDKIGRRVAKWIATAAAFLRSCTRCHTSYYPDAKPRKWTPPFVTRFGVIPQV